MSKPVPDNIAAAAWYAAWNVAILVFLGTWAVEAVIWLKTARWPGWEIGDLGPTPQSRWRGVQVIVDWLMTLPIGFLYAIGAALLAGWSIRYGYRLKRWWAAQ